MNILEEMNAQVQELLAEGIPEYHAMKKVALDFGFLPDTWEGNHGYVWLSDEDGTELLADYISGLFR